MTQIYLKVHRNSTLKSWIVKHTFYIGFTDDKMLLIDDNVNKIFEMVSNSNQHLMLLPLRFTNVILFSLAIFKNYI